MIRSLFRDAKCHGYGGDIRVRKLLGLQTPWSLKVKGLLQILQEHVLKGAIGHLSK